VTLVHKYFGGQSPVEWAPESFADPAVRTALESLIATARTSAVEVPRAFEELRLHDALDQAWNVVERANEFTDRAKPWELGKDPARRAELATTLAALLEALRLTAVWAWPAIPVKAEELWKTLGLAATPGVIRGDEALPRFGPTAPRALQPTAILFPRIALEADVRSA
jgi:methionyl-tRNA synthetase